MDAPILLDLSVDIKIPRSVTQFDDQKHKYKCSCCGKGFNTIKGTFHKSNSPLFQSNDGYLPWCNKCEDKYLVLLTGLYSNNEEHAIRHYCQQADWVYDIEVLKQAREISSDRSRISHYSAKKNLNVEGRKTYIDSLKFSQELQDGEIISSREQAKSDEVNISVSAVDRWGTGFKPPDYKNLDDHYRMLKKNNPNADNNQEIFIKSLCNINMLMIRALQRENAKEYSNLVEQYSKTFTKAGLKTVVEKDSSNDEVFGVTLATISQYTPEEFYKDKTLYEDWDLIGEYYDRHVCRPMQNLMTGTDIRDVEFFVPENGDDDD